MELSKLEIQQMLREMNIKFDAEESYESLKNRLQKENHHLWLKSVSTQKTTDGKIDKVVVRKRKRKGALSTSEHDTKSDAPETAFQRVESSSVQKDRASVPANKPFHRQPQVEKPSPGKPWKEVANGTEPFNRKKKVFESVLRRAGNNCEQCGAKTGVGPLSEKLQPYHILPLDQGGEHTIKNVVALCSNCLASMMKDPDPKMIKTLKRCTRAKLYGSIKVERRSSRRNPRRTHRSRR